MYNSFRLNNGLRVVVENIENYNSVSVGLWVKNGSRNETKELSGISHFIEHMMFKGTENRNSKQIVESIENVGGQINAFTGKESTCYYVKLLDSHIELGLDILSDMLFNSKFDYDDIEKEKKVVIEEINMGEDSPEDVLIELHEKAMWGDDTLSMPILGHEESVKSFTKEKIINYISEHYYPHNCVLSICGKISMDEIEKMVERYFGLWKSVITCEHKYSTPVLQNNIYFRSKDIEQLHVSLGMKGLQMGSEESATSVLLANILGGGASSILFQRIREELAMCYSIYVYMSPYVNCGSINIGAALNPNKIKEAIEAINEELMKFYSGDITEEKLARAKEQLKGSYMLGLESTSSRMFGNGKSLLFKNKIESPSDVINKIDKINMGKVKDVMNNTFKKGIISSAFVGKEIGELRSIYGDKIKKIDNLQEP